MLIGPGAGLWDEDNVSSRAELLAEVFVWNRDVTPTTRIDYLAHMYRIILACKGLPTDVGAVAACDVTEEFTHRPWHRNARCEWDGSRLVLQADNDFDSNGLALMDEFSDAIAAHVAKGFDGGIEVVSVSPVAD